MTMYDKERAIIAMNAGTAAASVIGAIAARVDDINVINIEYFEAWRDAIAKKTWSMAQAKEANPTTPPPAPATSPEYDEAPFGPAPAPATPTYAPASPQPQTPIGPSCIHGPRVFKSGLKETTGQAWRAWFCPLPKGSQGVCSAIWA